MDNLPMHLAVKIRETPAGCWEWTASRTGSGYGKVAANGRLQQAHRVVYELEVGPIPAGLELDHLCRNKLCVNPAHLEPVTRRENLLRGDTVPARNARVTACPKGHAYTPENTFVSKRNQRNCRECAREYQRLRRRRLRGVA